MLRRGFTIVELIITITIMGLLMIIAVVNIIGNQVQARDDERTTDVAAIANHLESYYRSGTTGSTVTGRYPTTNLTSSLAIMKSELQNIDEKVLVAPSSPSATDTFIPALNNVQTTTGVDPLPETSEYVYQPINSSGALCTGTSGTEDCRKFNLYYRLETNNTVYMVTSKNQ